MFVAARWQFNEYKSLVKSNWNELSQCSRFILYDYLKQYDHKIKLILRVTNNNTKSLNTKNNYKAQNDACVCVCKSHALTWSWTHNLTLHWALARDGHANWVRAHWHIFNKLLCNMMSSTNHVAKQNMIAVIITGQYNDKFSPRLEKSNKNKLS